jgi:hypothetical protein
MVMSRSGISLLLMLVYACGAVAAEPALQNGATRRDLVEVGPVIRARSNEPILSINRLPDGTLEVQAGHICGTRCGSGTSFRLRKLDSNWKIIHEAYWVL